MKYTLIGLIFNMVGSLLLVKSAILGKKKINEYSIPTSDKLKMEDYLKSNQCYAIWGAIFLSIGFLLQIIPFIWCR
jgi:hypothetical protein